MYGWTDGPTHGQAGVLMDGSVDEGIDVCVDGCVDESMDWMDGADGCMNGWMDVRPPLIRKRNFGQGSRGNCLQGYHAQENPACSCA